MRKEMRVRRKAHPGMSAKSKRAFGDHSSAAPAARTWQGSRGGVRLIAQWDEALTGPAASWLGYYFFSWRGPPTRLDANVF